MVSPAFIVGIIGNVVSILVYAAPLGPFRDMVKEKSTEKYDVLPYVATLLCKTLWTMYGIFKPNNGLLIITVNGIGIVVEAIYVIIYLIYAPRKEKVRILILVGLLNIVFLGLVVVLALTVLHGKSERNMFMGFVCAAVTIAMYVAPLRTMKNVIKMKSVEYMSFSLSLVFLMNAGCWFTFALLMRDPYVLVPNAIGILTSSCQLLLYFMYKNKVSTVIDEEKDIGSLKVTKIVEVVEEPANVEAGKLESESLTEGNNTLKHDLSGKKVIIETVIFFEPVECQSFVMQENKQYHCSNSDSKHCSDSNNVVE